MEKLLLIICPVLYLLAALLYYLRKKPASHYLLLAAALLHLVLLIVRSLIAKHPPFTNMYETFLLLPFLIALRCMIWPKQTSAELHPVLYMISAAFLLAALLLPASMSDPRPLMPALNSPWMYIHVPAYFFGYMSMIVALIYALIILFRSAKGRNAGLRTLAEKLDKEIRISFYFLNLGLITGAIWAYVSWGTYWSWDPKETWALINILILAFALHLKTPTAVKKAWIVIITVLSIAFTYWGVSFILTGLHSYA
jgi:ABC-type transport system involved in cytochrome c biogenesis permease subunit